MITQPFLTAHWKHLIMANYAIEPKLLASFLPAHVELDPFEGQTFVSLVGFLFDETKLKGFSIPLHTRFPEINLRFYVKRKTKEGWRRGVVFISELVPMPAICWVANTLFKENYRYTPVTYAVNKNADSQTVQFAWKQSGKWNTIKVEADLHSKSMETKSPEYFIFEHYYGYAKKDEFQTIEYRVQHPSWQVFPIQNTIINCNFSLLYGEVFAHLQHQTPAHVFLTAGSPVAIYPRQIISN